MKAKHLILGLASTLLLVSCGEENSSSEISTNPTETSSRDTSDNPQTSAKALVVYFSATNHTENVANYIANHLGVSTFELEPVNPYTSSDLNYGNSNSRVSLEHNDPNRNVELKSVTVEGFSEATHIFLGAPVWWGELSWVINNFVSQNNFEGKTIIPFGTSASSSFTTSNLEKLATNATWLAGQRFSSSVSESTVTTWVDSLNLSL